MSILRSALTAAILALFTLSLFSGCETDSKEYLRLAKSTFERSTRNDPKAAEAIDWNSIVINDNEIGRGFMTLSTDYEKNSYKNATINNLSRLFSSRDWNVTNVKNWRVTAQGVESAIVLADAPGGQLKISFQKVQLEKKIVRIYTN